MAKLSNQTRTKIFVRLKSRRVNKSDKLSDYIKKVYGKSEMLRIIGDKPYCHCPTSNTKIDKL